MFKWWLAIATSRHESILLWRICMSRIRDILSSWISLVERSHSSFCSYCFYMHVCRWGCSSFFWRRWQGMLVGGPDWWGLGSPLELIGVGCPMELTHFWGEGCVFFTWEMISLPHKNYAISFEALFWLQNICIKIHGTIIYNNYLYNLNIMVLHAFCCVCNVLASLRTTRYDLTRWT
jgi:hypothetical protein